MFVCVYVLVLVCCRFLRLWIAVLVIYPTNQAVIALTFSNYVLQPIFPTCFPPENGLRLLAAICLCKSCCTLVPFQDVKLGVWDEKSDKKHEMHTLRS